MTDLTPSDLKEIWGTVDYLDGLLQGLELRMARLHREYGPSGAMPHDYVLRKHLEPILAVARQSAESMGERPASAPDGSWLAAEFEHELVCTREMDGTGFVTLTIQPWNGDLLVAFQNSEPPGDGHQFLIDELLGQLPNALHVVQLADIEL